MSSAAPHDFAFLSATEQLAALNAKDLSSAELVDLYLARITKHNAPLNAVVTVDADGARRAAKQADAARSNGQSLGPLHGLPITVKDSYETVGMRTVCGRPDLADYVPTQDAEAVARLRRAGAIILGKTNMPTGNADVQASNPVFGKTNNPWDRSRTSGGSAGGGAAAAAAGLTSFDFGSEIGGSTRIPAHFCGLYGHKSTWQSVPLVGHIPGGPGDPGRWGEADMACAGVQVRGARDIIPALEATVGPLNPDGGFSYTLAAPRATALKDFRVAVWADDPACPIDNDTHRAVGKAVAALRDSGARVVEQPASIPVDLTTSHDLFLSLVMAAFSIDRSTMSPRFAGALALRSLMSPRGDAAAALRGTIQSHRAWLFRDAARREIAHRWAGFFKQFDVLLLPVTPTAAPGHHNKDHDRFGRTIDVDGITRSYWDQTKWSAVANIAGTPATTMPITTNAAGLPVGLQAMGPAGGDRTTVEFAALLTEVLGGYRIPPQQRASVMSIA
ncbi:amidase, Asp-tRNAAsn/Glu-tRNAGln amidotransferase A subunit [Mycobacterium sp. JS623]|uniref:amidase n=1 Tax=Mycobacterium sp. JS623 TaxID=212767 RepID=UPI0002A58D29|nr:amidase [Mycobacterium sp. JS623]AGB21640.1 amidase, Asp-tRNAAsn/Glu-tRNAGln amidotransferase A subunit [Mycobacterium sp. JS623]